MTKDEAIRKLAALAPPHGDMNRLVLALEALGLLEFTVGGEPVEEVAARTMPPPEWCAHAFHWLRGCGHPTLSVCEWLRGSWRPAHELSGITPELMYSRGWRWYAPAIPPAEWQGKRVDAP